MKKIFIILIPIILILNSCSRQSKLDSSISNIILIEERLQHANISEFERASAIHADFMYNYNESLRKSCISSKRVKLTSIHNQICNIEKSSENLIQLIENIKIKLLQKEKENISYVKEDNPNFILWRKYDKKIGCIPAKLNLRPIKKGKSTVIVNSYLVGPNLTSPSLTGKKLWRAFTNYRNQIVKFVGNYRNGNEFYSIDVKSINSFKNKKTLRNEIRKMLDNSSINPEDYASIEYIYELLTKPEFILSDGQKIYWSNSIFLDASLIGAISTLTALENEILRARTLALSHINSKIGHCCYSMNQIIPFVQAPTIVKEGQDIELKVSIVAFDSERLPTIRIKNSDAKIYYKDGFGFIKLKPKKGLNKFSGTVTVQNNSGVYTTEPWEYTINVIEK